MPAPATPQPQARAGLTSEAGSQVYGGPPGRLTERPYSARAAIWRSYTKAEAIAPAQALHEQALATNTNQASSSTPATAPMTTGSVASAPTAAPTGYAVKYNAPLTIPLGSPTTYRLIIESARPSQAGAFAGAPGPVASHTIAKVVLVVARMSGPGAALADVAPLSPPCQRVTNEDNPTWDWAVTPKSTHRFDLVVDIDEVERCDSTAAIVHRVDNFSIKVTASVWAWLLYVWPLWKAVLAGMLALVTAAGGAYAAWKGNFARNGRTGG